MAAGSLPLSETALCGSGVDTDLDNQNRYRSVMLGRGVTEPADHFIEDIEVGERLVPDYYFVVADTVVRLPTREPVRKECWVHPFGSGSLEVPSVGRAGVVDGVWVELHCLRADRRCQRMRKV